MSHRHYDQIKAERDELLATANALLDAADAQGRELTTAERKNYERLTSGIADLNLQMSNYRPVFSDRVPQPSGALDPEARMPRIESIYSGARLQAFADDRRGHEAAYRSGQWLRAALLGDAQAAQWCQAHSMSVDVRAAHSASENARGGVLVPEELARSIIRLIDQFGTFRANTRVVPMASDTLIIPRRKGGLTAHYVGEGVAGTESETAWDSVSLVAKKLMILARLSSELNDDAIISMADMLAFESAHAFAFKEDLVGYRGDGSAEHGGIEGLLVKVMASEHPKARVVAAGSANTADTLPEIAGDHVLQLLAMIPQYARPGAKFYCSPTALALVFDALKTAGGGNTVESLQGAVQPRFLGYPIVVSEIWPDDPAEDLSGKPMVGFGRLDLAATLGSRRELRFALSEHAHWNEDQIGVKGTMRHDINVHDLGSVTEKSPFAVLVGN
jgi:HK97 family phage major capsid protein